MGINCIRQHPDSYLEIGSYKLKLKKTLAKGDYGSVHVAVDSCKNQIAVKYVQLNSPEASRAFQREIEALNIIGPHENIVSVYHTEQKKEAGFILMEVAKMNIWEMISSTMHNHITETQVIYILRQIATGLQHIHSKKCAHKSIKAENILLMEDGRVKICDFGSSTRDEFSSELKETSTGSSQNRGNPENPQRFIRRSSKRQLNKGYIIDQKMDMWMFGCIAYILAFYQAPFRNIEKEMLMASSVKLPGNSTVSTRLQKFIQMLLVPDHGKRMTAQEALNYLNSRFVLDGGVVVA